MFPTEVTSFAQLFLNQYFIYIAFAVVNSITLYFASIKFLLCLQQCGYHGTRYFKWLGNPETPYLSRLMILCLMAVLFFCVLNICSIGACGNTIATYIGFASYFLFTLMYIISEKHVNAKVPLKQTKRMIRLSITHTIVLAVLSFGFMVLLDFIAYKIQDEVVAVLRYVLICVMPILVPYILIIGYGINEPLETIIYIHYVNQAKIKLAKSKILKIGITGSYGKTSVKEIINTILSQKYRVLASPQSFNTCLGIALTVKRLDGTHDIFIAEMGARQKGDIKELTKMVNPQYAVLTGINSQHLETFKSFENIKSTKYELFKYLEPNGKGFFASNNEQSMDLFNKFQGEKYCAGINFGLVSASNIKVTSIGSQFSLNIEGEESINCSTLLLGRHNIDNICLAAAVAYKIGMTPAEIAQGINRIKSVGHRLEIMPNNKDIVIIDDSYNANVAGVEAAMEVLDTFKGRKIVLTPGLVELGKEENIANLQFGKTLSSHANIVIITAKHNAEMLIQGLIDGGFNRENIIYAKSLNKGNEELNKIIQKGDVVLFENDLPDNYN